MKWTIFFLALLFPIATFASMFPNDAVTISYDANTGTSGTLLTSVSYPRSLLAVNADCDNTKDNHILIGVATTSTNIILDTETNKQSDEFISRTLPSDTAVTWLKEISANSCFFSLTYVPYVLASTSTSTLSSTDFSTPLTSVVFLLIGLFLLAFLDFFRRVFGLNKDKF